MTSKKRLEKSKTVVMQSYGGGGGKQGVHYGLCENGEFDIRIARSQARSSQNSNRQP